METKNVHSVVLDAGPLLVNQPSISTLLATCEQIFTVPSVLAEIKDEEARARVEITVKPFLTVRAPKSTSLKVVTEFSRKTGDIAVLSRTDLEVFGLAYELECERNHGNWRLRSIPGQKRLNGSPPASLQTKDLTTSKVPNITLNQERRNEEGSEASESSAIEQSKPSLALANTDLDEEGSQAAYLASTKPLYDTQTTSKLSELNLTDSDKRTENLPSDGPWYPHSSGADAAALEDSSRSDEDGWITPSNLKRSQQKGGKAEKAKDGSQAVMQVALVTTDFALQNSAIIMNLNLLSSSLSRILHLRSHVLRCHACFATTKDMTRQFCQRCGMPTLTRVSCSSTSNGGHQLHLKKNMQWNTRGDRYSIPKPASGTSSGKLGKGGRGKGGKGGWGNQLVLAEDQKEYIRAVGAQKREKRRDLMDDDYLPAILTGERGSGGKIQIGAGRNINSRKR